MHLLVGIVLIVLFICSPVFRCMIFHPFKTVFNTIGDSLEWLFHAGWRRCKSGKLVSYCGLFGKGKTLSAVHEVTYLYKKYNDKKVYDKFRKRWVRQKIVVYSNVDLAIPYIKFTGLQQMVDVAAQREQIDEACGTLTISLFLGDEFSVQMNSRAFKSNFNPLLLNTILTCRHHYISLYMTSQRFAHCDALLRQVTSYVVDCDKVWRYVKNYYYDAWEMENATNVMLLKPIRRKCWFATNKEFANYDTLACVDNLVKDCKDGKMLSDKEILELQGYDTVGLDGIVKPSRKLKKARKAGA